MNYNHFVSICYKIISLVSLVNFNSVEIFFFKSHYFYSVFLYIISIYLVTQMSIYDLLMITMFSYLKNILLN